MSEIEDLHRLEGLSPRSRALENARFDNKEFERLLIGPGIPPQSIVRVTNCVFSRCFVRGEFRVAPGVELSQVVFDSVSSPESMVINTQAVLNEVVVKGSPKTGGLWVRPAEFIDAERKQLYESWVSAASETVGLMLDFSDFDAEETEVIGLPLSKLKWNRERHAAIRLQWKDLEAWKQLGLSPTSFWSLRMKRLQSYGATEGVFALPCSQNDKCAKTMQELAQIKEAGLLC